MAETAKEARRNKDLQKIDDLEGYIDKDSDQPDTQGTDTLRAARKKLILNENALQYREHEAATEEHDTAAQWDDIMTSFENDSETGVEFTEDSRKEREKTEATLKEHTLRSAAFSAQHLDVLRNEARRLADEDLAKEKKDPINIEDSNA